MLNTDATEGPLEVESTLKLHPAVVESAVIGVNDTARGEIVKAFVVLDEAFRGIDPVMLKKELQETVNEKPPLQVSARH